MLIAAMNPCKCGYYGHPSHACTCTPSAIERYRAHGPCSTESTFGKMEPIAYGRCAAARAGNSAAAPRARVMAAQKHQQSRYPRLIAAQVHYALLVGEAPRYAACVRSHRTQSPPCAYDAMGLSARGYDRVLRVARTIADLAGEANITEDAILGAVVRSTRRTGMRSNAARCGQRFRPAEPVIKTVRRTHAENA